MPIELGCAGLRIQPNHVYIVPSGKEMTLGDGLLLQTRSKPRGWPNVVTIFLDSISISRHPGIAVILSGLDSDGAAALRAFKESGGITIVQAPQSAERAQMPLAAIQTGASTTCWPRTLSRARLKRSRKR
jgi:chemotaxis response regulator CheB